MTPDSELLAAFARTNSGDAFAELVRRHVNLVYSAALRQVHGDAHLAQDVAQTVFADLARKAGSLSRRASLAGWLYTSAHFAAAKIIRGDSRRRDREGKFMRDPGSDPASETDWDNIRPALDAAMHELKESDREAILLRFFENRPFAEVGEKLGLNENAARMRVERALEKLRAVFAKRDITTVGALASVISANAVQLAPANLGATLATVYMTTTGTGTFTLLKIMTATQLKLAISALVIAGTATALVVQHQTQNLLREQNESLARLVRQLTADNLDLSNRLATAIPPARMSNGQMDELLRLRGEVGTLRRQIGQMAQLRDENGRLQAALANANARIETAHNPAAPVDPVEQYRINTVNAAKQIGLAMRIFGGDNSDQYPTNLDQIIEYLGSATNFIGGVKLDDFELVNVGVPDLERQPNAIALRQKTPIQTPGGSWYRIYCMADGSVQTAESPDGNFDAWEKQNTEVPVASQ